MRSKSFASALLVLLALSALGSSPRVPVNTHIVVLNDDRTGEDLDLRFERQGQKGVLEVYELVDGGGALRAGDCIPTTEAAFGFQRVCDASHCTEYGEHAEGPKQPCRLRFGEWAAP